KRSYNLKNYFGLMMKFKNFIKYLNYKKLRNIEKLYFDLIVMIILSSVSFLFLAFKFLICKDILIFLQNYLEK
ncbi:hypothetical protein ACTFDD_02370, partial [Campylobacter jejuni]|nr:hypothetical protein [Campylobacter jejuni]EAH8412210.1 hypothetical protein [Campylobacter jejuni]